MRSAPVLLSLVLLAIPSSGPLNEGPTIEGPSLVPGDFWTYRTETTVPAGLSLQGEVTLRVTDRSTIALEGTPYDVYNFSFSGEGTASGRIALRAGSTNASGSWVLTGWELAEVRGLKRLWTVLDLEANGRLETEPVRPPFALRLQNTTRYHLVSDSWHFPLRVGDSATIASRMNFTEDFAISIGSPTTTPVRSLGVSWWNVTYTLEPAVQIDTPAGTFEAFPIAESTPDGMRTRFFYATRAGNYVRTETRNETSELGTSDLTAYRYQALEPPTFLGLTFDRWGLVALVVGAGATAFAWWWKRKKKRTTEGPVLPPP